MHDKPLIAVNHLEAHALTARLTDGTPFPYCLFLASGGHTQILGVRGVGDYLRLGGTLDDAIGEAFDKTAKLLGLGYPGGPLVEKEAARGDPERFALPRPMTGRHDANFSLSGLKTALRLEAQKIAPLSDGDVADLCASFQQAVGEVVMDRLRTGLHMFRDQIGTPTALVCAGGVAANQAIRKALHRVAFEIGTIAGRAAAGFVHRQWRHDRLGRRRASGARPDRPACHRAARALAAHRSDKGGGKRSCRSDRSMNQQRDRSLLTPHVPRFDLRQHRFQPLQAGRLRAAACPSAGG